MKTEGIFHKYSAFSTTPTAKASEEERTLERQLEELFDQRDSVIANLSRILDSEPNSSTAKLQNLLRHREVLADHRKEFGRIKSSIQHARDRENLLSSVRNDINQYHSSSARGGNRDRFAELDEEEYMLDERQRLDSSHNMADSVLAQAYAINSSFSEQRAMLQNAQRRIMMAAGRIPGINAIIGKINTRKKRDSVIIALLISFCALLLLWLR